MSASPAMSTEEQTSEITLADVVAELRAIRLLLEAQAASTQAVAISTVATTQFPVVI
jgi:hypothetical protein